MKASPALRAACVLLACAFELVAARGLPAQPAVARSGQSQAPTRSPDAPGAPTFIRLEGPGQNPPVNTTANYIVGPDYVTAPESKVVEGVPQGRVMQFTMESKDSRFYNPGISRTQLNIATGEYRGVFGTVDPQNPKTLIVKTRTVDFARTITDTQLRIRREWDLGARADVAHARHRDRQLLIGEIDRAGL